MIYKQPIELSLVIKDGEKLYDLDGFMFEAEYEIEGEDYAGSYEQPPESQTWILNSLKFVDQSRIDEYNADSEGEYWDPDMPPLPWKAGDDIFKSLQPHQIYHVEYMLEENDREDKYSAEADAYADRYDYCDWDAKYGGEPF